MKHRRNKVKREHGIIQNALEWLENLSRLAEVTDIIPGVIDVNRSSERGIVYKYETKTGCKLLLKSSGSIQEAFVVTRYPERVREWVNKEFPPPEIAAEELDPSPSRGFKNEPRKKASRVSPKPVFQAKPSSRKGSKKDQVQSDILIDHKALRVADQLDTSTRKALKQLRNSLEMQRSKKLNKGKQERKS